MDTSAIFNAPAWADLQSNVRALFSLPTIGLPSQAGILTSTIGAGILKALSVVGLDRGIPIYATSQQEIGQNNIGDQIMLRSTELGTQVVTDNIAPLPRQWRIQGYVSSPLTYRFNWVGDYFLNSNNSILISQAIKNYLRYLRTLRAPFRFITREGDVIDVLIENFTLTDVPESEWATQIDLQLKEYIALGVNEGGYDVKNVPDLGSIFGASAQYATAGTKMVTKVLNLYLDPNTTSIESTSSSSGSSGSTSEDGTEVSLEDMTAEEEEQYLVSLGASYSVLKDISLDSDHDNLALCKLPFSALQDSTDESVTVPVEFGGNTINFTLHKELSDGSWWLDEKGTVKNVTVNTTQRFMLNSYKHRYDNWMYVIISSYSYSEDNPDVLKRQCIANCSLLIKY